MSSNFVCAFIFGVCFNMVLASESIGQDNYKERPVGRAYSLTTCDYRSQIGYTCISCNRALHCYPGNVAILVDCYGPFRFCRDGRCSRFQGDKCVADTKVTTPDTTLNASMPPSEVTGHVDATVFTEATAQTAATVNSAAATNLATAVPESAIETSSFDPKDTIYTTSHNMSSAIFSNLV